MTDARALRERVAKAIADAYYRDVTDGHFGIAEMGQSTEWLSEADAAIDLVLEEAAREAECVVAYGESQAVMRENISRAIRALKSGGAAPSQSDG